MRLPPMPPAHDFRVSDFVWCEQPLLVLSYPLPHPLPLHRLTDCEAAVVLLAQTGISNKEIAHVRVTSVRTIANQLASAYRKLGGASRACLKAAARPRRATAAASPALASDGAGNVVACES